MSQLDRNTATLNELLELAQNLPEAGTALPELSNPGTAADLLSGKELIDADGNIVVGTIPTVNASSIRFTTTNLASRGVISASYTHSAGYKATAETITREYSLSTQSAKTITPTTSTQTAVAKGKWTTGAVTVAPIPSNYADVSGLVIEPQDVVAGIEFVDGDGNRNTGKLNLDKVFLEATDDGDWLTCEYGTTIQDGDFYYNVLHNPNLGTVTPDKVLKGETFSSVYGGDVHINAEGTLEVPDLSAVTAEAKYVAQGYNFVDSEGNVVAGTLATNKVRISTADDSIEFDGADINSMYDPPILDLYDPDLGTAEKKHVLEGRTFSAKGELVSNGTMPNIGSVNDQLDLMSGVETYTVPKGYHDGTGTVKIGDDLKDALITINGNTATNVAGAVDNVDTAVTDQANLISQIQTALEGKAAGGGGSVETCTLRMYFDSSVSDAMLKKWRYTATIYENGAITTIADLATDGTANREVVINNVVCGSFAYIQGSSKLISPGSYYTNLNYVATYNDSYNYGYFIYARVTAPSNGEATFYIFDDD